MTINMLMTLIYQSHKGAGRCCCYGNYCHKISLATSLDTIYIFIWVHVSGDLCMSLVGLLPFQVTCMIWPWAQSRWLCASLIPRPHSDFFNTFLVWTWGWCYLFASTGHTVMVIMNKHRWSLKINCNYSDVANACSLLSFRPWAKSESQCTVISCFILKVNLTSQEWVHFNRASVS